MGAGINSWSANVSSLHTGSSNTSLVYGPEAGYDFRIASAVSIGAEVHYLMTNADGGANNLQGLASLKVWM